MKQFLIDTNIILRFFLQDNLKLANQAEAYFQKAKAGKISLFCPQIVIFELVFVLEKVYQFEKGKVIAKLKSFLLTAYIEIETREILLKAMGVYQKKNIDFVDIFLFVLAKEKSLEILSFDRDFRKLTV